LNFDKIISDATKNRWKIEMYTTCSFCEKEYTFDEFINAKSVWVDAKNKNKYGKTTLCECGIDLFSQRWNIISKNDNYFISTIHLPMPHGGVEFQDWMDRGFWYETMFWQEDPGQQRKFADFQQRYHTREEAIKGHRFVVENLNKILENPEGFPQGIISMMSNAFGAIQDQRKNIDPHVKENLR
jgi:hypothetical protein